MFYPLIQSVIGKNQAGLFFRKRKITTVVGGTTRFQSVNNGLKAIKANTGLVAVHDGVRPFITKAIIEDSFHLALEKGSAVVAVDSKDSVRFLDGVNNKAIERNKVKIVQTPQTFDLELLKKHS